MHNTDESQGRSTTREQPSCSVSSCCCDSPIARFFQSSIGKKIVVALTGSFLLLFVLAHLLGNLQIFLGQDTFNAYAKTLQSVPELLWPARIALLVILLTHLAFALQLRKINRSARPVTYQYKHTIQASAASLYMLESGLVILAFVVIHLLHFTFGKLQPEFYHLVDSQGRHDVYSMAIHGFQDPTFAGIYAVALLFLGFHLSHAISSLLQTLGLHHPYYFPKVKAFGCLLAALIAVGYLSIPLSVQLGILNLPIGGH